VQVLVGGPVAEVSSLRVGLWVDLVDPTASAAAGGGSARVVFDYSDLRLGYAAGLAGRLRLLRGVDCKADDTGGLSCADLVPVEAANDTLNRTLSFEVSDSALPPGGVSGVGAVSGGGGLFVLSSGPSGEGGDFAATPLSVLSSYQVGLFSGHFEVSYPFALPPAFWGPEPEVVLSYSSGRVDGLTSERNTQVGWVGAGWDYSPGFVSRQFDSNWFGDLVLAAEDVFSLTLGGVSSRLVEVGAGVFRLEDDPDWKLELLTGASNGDEQGSGGA
jgi:hypothetical protein